LKEINHPEQYIRKMMEEFQIPSGDALDRCSLSSQIGQKLVIDAEILISNRQSEQFYTDIFHFWVRAFFFFTEDMWLGPLFDEVIPFIGCKKISVEKFSEDYHWLLNSRIKDDHFQECQARPQSYVEIDKRTFSEAYMILDRNSIKSAVAESDGEYVAYFQTVPKGNN
jgi:hypothetical protein